LGEVRLVSGFRLAAGGLVQARAASKTVLKTERPKKTGAIKPRSNNDKRRMVTRRLRQPRTVKTDSGFSAEFEIFSLPCKFFLRFLRRAGRR
jgi:hypothetical protein